MLKKNKNIIFVSVTFNKEGNLADQLVSTCDESICSSTPSSGGGGTNALAICIRRRLCTGSESRIKTKNPRNYNFFPRGRARVS